MRSKGVFAKEQYTRTGVIKNSNGTDNAREKLRNFKWRYKR